MVVCLDNFSLITEMNDKRILTNKEVCSSYSYMSYATVKYANKEEFECANTLGAENVLFHSELKTVNTVEEFVQLFKDNRFEGINQTLTSIVNAYLKYVCKLKIAMESIEDLLELVNPQDPFKVADLIGKYILDYIEINKTTTDVKYTDIITSDGDDVGIVRCVTLIPDKIMLLNTLRNPKDITNLLKHSKPVYANKLIDNVQQGIYRVAAKDIGNCNNYICSNFLYRTVAVTKDGVMECID